MPSTPSPNARTVDHLRRAGYVVQLVEHRDRFGKTHDLWGFVDVLALKGDETLAIQATTADHTSHRVTKIAALAEYGAAKAAGWRVEVWGWRPWDYAGDLPALKVVAL